MAKPSNYNPLGYIVNRQYDDTISIKNKLFKHRMSRAKNLYRKDLLGHYGCVNAIEFSEEGELLVSGGDDRRVLLWSVPEAIFDKGVATAMETRHFSNIFCLALDSTNSKIFSGGNDDQVIVHDAKTGHIVTKLPHVRPVYGLSMNPDNDYVVGTAGDDGRVLIYDIRESNAEPLCLAKQKTGFHSVKYNPLNSRLLVTANSEEGIALWDIRKPREPFIHYDGAAGEVSGISACFNAAGTQVLALRRRLPPVLYATHAHTSICQFYHPDYYNSCTMKTCSFAGDNDEYVLSGSDDFNLYMWRIPQDNAEWGPSHLVLTGHRSIVNQVRYNKHCNLIASSGVEKMVKLWSSLPIGTWSGNLLLPEPIFDEPLDEVSTNISAIFPEPLPTLYRLTTSGTLPPERPIYSHDEYMYLVGGTGAGGGGAGGGGGGGQQQRISHDYSEHSVEEDSRMMAFFDSLIQREIEGWESPSEDTFTSDSDSDVNTQEKIRLSWQSLLRGRKMADDLTKKHKPNRIAQLIAQKRNKLAKMAHWKSNTLVQRLSTREKHKKRNKHIHKYRPKHHSKNNGLSAKKTASKHRQQSVSSPTNVSNSEKENRSQQKQTEPRVKMYRTRQNNKDYEAHKENANSREQHHIIDMPSTSTGITTSSPSAVYRTTQVDDSDDDLTNNTSSHCDLSPHTPATATDANNLVNIIPTPLNGTHDMYVNVLEVANGNVVVTRRGGNGSRPVRRQRQQQQQLQLQQQQQRGSSSSVSSDGDLGCCVGGGGGGGDSDSESEGECQLGEVTPVKQRSRTRSVSQIDSGFATGGPSSSSGYSKRRRLTQPHTSTGATSGNTASSSVGRHHAAVSTAADAHDNGRGGEGDSSDDGPNYERFRKRVKKARVNIRKQMRVSANGGDSDSN